MNELETRAISAQYYGRLIPFGTSRGLFALYWDVVGPRNGRMRGNTAQRPVLQVGRGR